jgi:septum formation protein
VSEDTLILLASSSPRRRELIALGNWTLSVSASNVDESQHLGETASEYVLRLAEVKARVAGKSSRLQDLIVAADTVVVDQNTLLGKPKDRAEAVKMLQALRGHNHQVYTGLAVLKMSNNQLLKDLCVTNVPMRDYSDAEIETYASTGDPLDKAGAYAIQDPGFHPVADLNGCYASVMGLPLCHLVRVLQKMDITPSSEIPANCQTYLHYHCPVSRSILRGEQVG